MQEVLTKERVRVEPAHSRLGWIEEVFRGVVTILFGFLIPFTLTIFISVLAIYLVLDGALELIIMGRGETAHLPQLSRWSLNRSPRLKPGDFPRPSPIQVPASSARGFPDCHPGLLLPGLHRQ